MDATYYMYPGTYPSWEGTPMRIGSEGNHIADVKRRGWRGSLDFVHQHFACFLALH